MFHRDQHTESAILASKLQPQKRVASSVVPSSYDRRGLIGFNSR